MLTLLYLSLPPHGAQSYDTCLSKRSVAAVGLTHMTLPG